MVATVLLWTYIHTVSLDYPDGSLRVYVQDGAKKRPKLELDPPADAVVRRIFGMVLQGSSILDVTKTLNAEGIPTTNGKKWLKTTIHTMLDVSNQQKRDGLRPERSGVGWRFGELPEGPVVCIVSTFGTADGYLRSDS